MSLFGQQHRVDNLVPNWSFEEHVKGINPYGSSKGRIATHWFSPTGGDPDFFIKWSRKQNDRDNWPGFKLARTGECFYGFITRWVFTFGNAGDNREYISVKLKRPLVKNLKYKVTFYVQLAQNCLYATDGIGAYFSEDSIDEFGYAGLYTIKPQITSEKLGIIKTTTRWKKIAGEYRAKGGEQFLTIGNFKPNKDTQWEEMDEVGKYNIYTYAYYFIDDVSVVPVNYFENDLIVGQTNILKHLLFTKGKAELLSGSLEELSKLLKIMNEYPSLEIEISGHTDDSGNESYNQKLSLNRAKAVAEYLFQEGISRNRIKYIGYGSSKPIMSNDTPEGQKGNRRVEFMVLKI